MKRVLKVPANGDSAFEVDIDEYKFDEQWAKDHNPYFVAGELLDGVTTEMVKTPMTHSGIFMFVDEIGMYKDDLPVNDLVSNFLYPGPIKGDVVVMHLELVYTDEGPDYEIRDFAFWPTMIVLMESQAGRY